MIIAKQIIVLPSEIAVIMIFFDGVKNNCICHLKKNKNKIKILILI